VHLHSSKPSSAFKEGKEMGLIINGQKKGGSVEPPLI
jgi:hypothetical protein